MNSLTFEKLTYV